MNDLAPKNEQELVGLYPETCRYQIVLIIETEKSWFYEKTWKKPKKVKPHAPKISFTIFT